ncbi:MAG: RNA methyltransferase [Draconibacterium sp.]|nr:RNA methyltransferase [Draconibacterium sp.]
MIGKNTIKLIKSLGIKKYRTKENLFLVEGDKNVVEVLKSKFQIDKLYATKTFISGNENACKKAATIFEVEQTEINKASLLQNPQRCLAICSIPEKLIFPEKLNENISIYLDDIQDPGNLGTIIRICDWFNIEYLFCSPNTVDLWNPKVIQASMGSFCRVQILKAKFIQVANLAQLYKVPIYGAFLDGKNIYTEKLPKKAILILGNEGNGINEEVENGIDIKIKIPEFSGFRKSAESLNVSVATAIICSEFKRRNF